MKIQKLDNQKCSLSFGTYLGLGMQEIVLLAKQKKLLTSEQHSNLLKIENDGLLAVLDLTKNYVVKKCSNNKKGVLSIKRILSVIDTKQNKIDIQDMSDAYIPTSCGNKVFFAIAKFLKIFNNDFNLPQKVKQACEQLSNKA